MSNEFKTIQPRIVVSRNNGDLAASSTDLLQTNFGSVSSSGIIANAGTGGDGTDGLEPVLRDGSASSSYSKTDPNATNAVNGAVLTYTLDTSLNTGGYRIDQIDIFHGWRDGGRDQISNFDVAYATAADPGVFIDIVTDADSGNYNSSYGRTSIAMNPSGEPLATGVASIRFTFDSIENGYGGISEIDIIGSAAVPEPSTLSLAAVGLLGLLRRRRRNQA